MPPTLIQCCKLTRLRHLHLSVVRSLNCLIFSELYCCSYPLTVILRSGSQEIHPPNTINSRYTPPWYHEGKHHYFSVISRMNCLYHVLKMLDEIKLISSTGNFHTVKVKTHVVIHGSSISYPGTWTASSSPADNLRFLSSWQKRPLVTALVKTKA